MAIRGDRLDISGVDGLARPGRAARCHPASISRRARAAARDILSALTPGSDGRLRAEAGREARLLCPLERDRVRVLDAIDAAVHDVEGDLGQAVAARCRSPPPARRRAPQVVVSSPTAPASSAGCARGGGAPSEVVTVGTPIDNAAIVLRRRPLRGEAPGADGRAGAGQFLVVANFGRAPRDLYVTMQRRERVRRARLAPRGGEARASGSPCPSRGSPRRATTARRASIFEVSPHDAMPIDDVAYGQRACRRHALPGVPGGRLAVDRARPRFRSPMVDLRAGTVAEPRAAASGDRPRRAASSSTARALASGPGGDTCSSSTRPRAAAAAPSSTRPWRTSPRSPRGQRRPAHASSSTLDGVHVARAPTRSRPTEAGAAPRRRGARGTSRLTSPPARAPAPWSASTSARATGRSRLRSSSSCATSRSSRLRGHRAHGVTGPARTGEPMRVSVLPPSATHVERDRRPRRRAARGVPAARRSRRPARTVARAGFYRITWQGPQAGATLVPANSSTSAAESDLSAGAAAPGHGDGDSRQRGGATGRAPRAHLARWRCWRSPWWCSTPGGSPAIRARRLPSRGPRCRGRASAERRGA